MCIVIFLEANDRFCHKNIIEVFLEIIRYYSNAYIQRQFL
jgi:hypothetical protein